MTMPVPSGVESGTVTWSVLSGTQDTTDADREPNYATFSGTVLFTPSRSWVRRISPGGGARDYTIFLDTVSGIVGGDGILRDLSGQEGVVLISPYSTGIEETGWHWTVSFDLNQRSRVSFPIRFNPGETVDLTRVSPAVVTPEVVITKGDPGEPQPTSTTSLTSNTIGTGSKTFTIPSGIGFAVGAFVRAANGTNYMAGNVTAYSGTTLTVNMVETGGSGTFSSWAMTLSGVRGATGSTGPAGTIPAPITQSATSFTPSTGSKAFTVASGLTTITVGAYLRVVSRSVPGEYMAGPVTAYSGTTLTIDVQEFAGTTARTDWNVVYSGVRGAAGPPGTSSNEHTHADYTARPNFAYTTGSRRYVRLASINGQSATGGGSTTLLIGGQGDYGSLSRTSYLLTFTQRGSNAASVQAWSFGATTSNTPPSFYTRQVSEFVYELWGYYATFAESQQYLNVLSTFGIVTFPVDSSSTTAPTGLSAAVLPREVAADGTDLPTPETAVLRDTIGVSSFVQVTLTNPADAPEEPVRKAELDVELANRPLRTLTRKAVTANYTLVAADTGDVVLHSTASTAITITLPADAAGIAQEQAILGRQYGTGQITFAPATGVTLLSRDNANKTVGRYSPWMIEKTGANTYLLSGDITV